MAERLVIDTGPLVAFARAEMLDIIGKLPFEFLCPDEVYREISQGAIKGYSRIEPKWLTSMTLSSPIDLVAQMALDLGEAAVVQLALEKGVKCVCIDERKGRLVAQGLGLEVTGSLGLLVRAKELALVSELSPIIKRLKQVGIFYNNDLVGRVLRGVDEPSSLDTEEWKRR